jgi:hypothetical protein
MPWFAGTYTHEPPRVPFDGKRERGPLRALD